MFKAKNPDITYINYRGTRYEIEDAYPTAEMAKYYAEGARTMSHPHSKGYRCRCIQVDLGPDAGRLRYAIFIAKGARM